MPANDIYDKAVELGVRVYNQPVTDWEPCGHSQAKAWLLDNVMMWASGVTISPPPETFISVSIDPCGGPAVCPIRPKTTKKAKRTQG